jgi:hypothetical protein
MFHPVTINADWMELPPGVSVGGVDSLRDLGQQVGPSGYQVSQSFDDGLPDPVTMTMSADASGSMGTDLIGRPANIATTLPAFRSTTSGFGTATAIPVTMPSDLISSDYAIVAITVNGTEPVFEGTYGEGDPARSWQLLATVADSTYITYVFGRAHFLTTLAPTFKMLTSNPFTWAVVGIGSGLTGGPSNVWMRPGTVTTKVETVTGTSHTGPLATLPSRGYLLGVFATAAASGPWTPAGTGVELVENVAGTAALQLVRSPWTDTDGGSYQISSTTTGSTGVGMMVTIPLILKDRQAMDAMAFFSPFNDASPVKDFEHDTAPVETTVNVVSPVGVIGTSVFKGQMSDLTLNGRIASMQAVSKTRIELDKASTLPTVFGRRENCSTDWLASWLLAQGGQYIGVAPSPQTRWWAPAHGSLHAHMDGPNGYATSISYYADRTPKGPWSNYPAITDGPFLKAMFGQETDPRTDYNFWGADKKQWATEVPGMVGEFNDILSLKNSVGRLTFWLRGDANDVLPDSWSGTGLTDDRLVNVTITSNDGHGHNNFMSFRVDSSRRPQSFLENGFILTGGDMPTDGLWHFFGFAWDYANGLTKTRRDNVTWTTTGYVPLPLASSEADVMGLGGSVTLSIQARLPIAEIQLESGPNMYSELFTRFYPTPTAPSRNVTYRPTNQRIEAVAEVTPQQGWAALHELAKSTLSSLRVNEADNVEMVPLDYFGETAQMTVEAYNVISTDVNASELGVTTDASKTRNFVTVEFPETRVDTNRAPIISISSSIEIPRGITFMTFALDNQVAEVHGAIDPYGSTSWLVNKLTSAQIAAPATIPNDNIMTVNAANDGTGTVYIGSGFTAYVVGWTNSTVKIRFTNNTGVIKYLANNGDQVPFLRILGYVIRTSEAYESVRDAGSVAKRRERALTSQIRWVQRREEASVLASNMVTVLSRPRPQLKVQVMGDPRRKPGQLIRLADTEGTAADGTWRILAVDHIGNGPMYVQDLSLVHVGDVGVWDESNWDDAVWGV